jgi:hypothetical protein
MLFFYNEDEDSKFLRNIGTKLHSVIFQHTVILKHANFFHNVHHLKLELKKRQVCNSTRIPEQKEASQGMIPL